MAVALGHSWSLRVTTNYCSATVQGGSEFGAVSGYNRGAHRRQLVRDLPFRNKLDGGKPSFIWGNEFESGLSAVSLRSCGPLALIPVNGKKNEIGGKIRTKK
jgi:hypothetical protein